MARLLSLKPSDAPVGAIALIPIVLSAACFPFSNLFHENLRFYVFTALWLVCFLFFAGSALLSIYSLAAEKSKLFGILGILIVGGTFRFEPMTLYFLLPLSFYIPVGIVALVLVLGLRIWSRKHKPSSNQ